MGKGSSWRKIKTPSDSLLEHYAQLFNRNQSKFMRRSMLVPSHLGSEFVYEGITFKLVGSCTAYEMLIQNLEDQSYHMVHSDLITPLILES